ncbi:MAG: lasso peptide biosynthesis B2 protein [Gemmatimonadales bacterium]|nr:lasso peptide biosynthesis B2 protein [Gemmatimonadales bacterium]
MKTVEWRDLLLAQAILVQAQITVWTRPRGHLVAASYDTGIKDAETHDARAHQLGQAVRRAARFGVFRPSCLVRSVALINLLQRSGIPGGRLRIGVRPTGGKLLAHAWVEYGNRVLGDWPAHVRNFQPLMNVDVLPGSGAR